MYVRDYKYKDKAIGQVVDPNTPQESNLWKGIADNNINKNNPANPPAIFTIPAGFPSVKKSLHYRAKKVDDEFFERTKQEGRVSDEIKAKYGIEKQSGLPIKLDDLVVKNYRLSKPCRVYGGFANRRKLNQFAKGGFSPVEDRGGPMEFYINANAAIRYRRITVSPSNILSVLRGFGTTERMRGELRRMGIEFDYPKPVDLVSYLTRIGAEGKDALVLDSFAGSGTTAHAVLKQNAEDGGNRRFILVEMDANIAQTVTAERIKRAANGYTNPKNKKIPGLGGGFQFCRLSTEPLFTPDGQIRPDVTFAQLAEFVWFVETGSGFTGNTNSALLGIHEGRAIYLLYNGILKDKSVAGGNVLTGPVFNLLEPFDGPKVIFAAACRMGARLTRENIVFKQTPYALEI